MQLVQTSAPEKAVDARRLRRRAKGLGGDLNRRELFHHVKAGFDLHTVVVPRVDVSCGGDMLWRHAGSGRQAGAQR